MSNKDGRHKSNIEITSNEVNDFIRQIANLSEKQFSFSNPLLDVSIGRYRINAVHQSIVRVNDEKSISFSIRIASLTNRIYNDKKFMNNNVIKYLKSIINNKESIVISGSSGTGKTEFQKYLISLIEDYAHIIVIDNIQELESTRNDNVDITTWQVSPCLESRTFENLIRNALRNNPDWLIIAESRGKEMADALLSVMSGHPIITTIHASNALEAPNRITRMIQLANRGEKYNEIYSDVVNNIQNYIYLEKRIDKDKHVQRFIKSVTRYDKNTDTFLKIYERNEYEEV